jgi:hypothetical protein
MPNCEYHFKGGILEKTHFFCQLTGSIPKGTANVDSMLQNFQVLSFVAGTIEL